MNISIFYHDNKQIRHISIGWIGILLILCLLVGSIYWQIKRDSYQSTNFLQAQYHKHQQQSEIVKYRRLKSMTESQLKLLGNKLAYIEARIDGMDALSQELANKFDLEDQFKNEAALSKKLIIQDKDKQKNLNVIQLLQEIDEMISKLDHKYKSLILLDTVTRNHDLWNKRYISGRPIRKGWLSSPYGMRRDPFSGRLAMHKGIDFAGSPGSPVISTGAGVVVWAGEKFGYGKLVEVNHGNSFKTRYGHNKKISVKVGDIVTKGQEIARIGSTGRSTGPHVHYEVWKRERQVDPSRYVYRGSR
tara:strand:+ start:16799 stop:17707 length:909 start_codon:yes stop_codon:yes gene_type:complete